MEKRSSGDTREGESSRLEVETDNSGILVVAVIEGESRIEEFVEVCIELSDTRMLGVAGFLLSTIRLGPL